MDMIQMDSKYVSTGYEPNAGAQSGLVVRPHLLGHETGDVNTDFDGEPADFNNASPLCGKEKDNTRWYPSARRMTTKGRNIETSS